MNPFWRSPALVVISGGAILLLSMGIRQTLGLFLHPMTTDLGWSRETFVFAIALQSLLYGFVQPLVGMVADKYGAGRVLAGGGLLYALALYLMSSAATPLVWNLTAGLLLGLGMGATAMGVLAGAVGRAVPPEKRSMALGVVSAGGGIGHFSMLLFGQTLIAFNGWQTALMIFSILPLAMVPLAGLMAGKREAAVPEAPLSMRDALAEAANHKGFWLLTAGFFVCGFQVVFIGAHLPAFLVDSNLPPELGATALALIGFCNIFGSYLCGHLGGKLSKKYLLSAIYLIRALTIAAFIALPLTHTSVLMFAGVTGFLYLGTVPLTSALVGQIFGVRYLSTLFGIVFLSHQVGSFLGAWLGGVIYDATGSYDLMWYLSIALGLLAALLHWPINDAQVERLRLAQQPG